MPLTGLDWPFSVTQLLQLGLQCPNIHYRPLKGEIGSFLSLSIRDPGEKRRHGQRRTDTPAVDRVGLAERRPG